MTTPLVTIVVPARNEERWIGDCLASIVAQDYPAQSIEVIVVVDAVSDDRTDVVAKHGLDPHDFFRAEVVRSTVAGTPNNLNAGLAWARGAVLCRVDARSRIPSHYVRRCVELLSTRNELSVVGGAQIAIAPGRDDLGVGIARALNNRFVMGWSRYRRGGASGPSDTVYLGSFRTADLRDIGGWSSDFATNQDFELNRRLGARGVVWFDASIPVEYVPRESLRGLWAQYVRFGRWKVRYWRHTGDRPRPRQLAMLVGVPLVALGGLGVASRLPRRGLVGGSMVAVLVALEATGTQGPPARSGARIRAVIAIAMIAGGWLVGGWRELVRPRGDR